MHHPKPSSEEPEPLQLKGGRRLAWAQFGAANGFPVLLFHGLPGSRLQGHMLGALAKKEGARIIVFDRPGIGCSTFVRHRTLRESAQDALHLLDHLEVKKVTLLGISGGGPYALATAALAPSRVSRIALVGPLGPVHVRSLYAQWRNPLRRLFPVSGPLPLPLFRAVIWAIRRACPPRELFDWLRNSLPETDRLALSHYDDWRCIFEEPFRQGTAGVAWDLKLLGRPWHVPLGDVSSETRLWHGTADEVCPTAFSRWLHARLPRAELVELPGVGHYVSDHGVRSDILSWCVA